MTDDDKLIDNLQRKVKESQANLDARTLGQLRAARRSAIELIGTKSPVWWQLPVTRYVLSSTIAIALTLSIMIPLFTGSNEEYELEVVAISEDLELLENLEFYMWIIDSVENES